MVTRVVVGLVVLLLIGCAGPTPDASAGSGSINGWLWHDLCDTGKDGQPPMTAAGEGCIESVSPLGRFRADGIKAPKEPGIEGVQVDLGQGSCPSTGLAQTTSVASDLSYSFVGLPPGTYCVSIDASNGPNPGVLRPGVWTYPELSQGTVGQTVRVAQDQNVFDVNFGWDYQFKP